MSLSIVHIQLHQEDGRGILRDSAMKSHTLMHRVLTLKAPRKTASENVVCLCRLLNILANFSKLFFAYWQTVWTQIRLLLKAV